MNAARSDSRDGGSVARALAAIDVNGLTRYESRRFQIEDRAADLRDLAKMPMLKALRSLLELCWLPERASQKIFNQLCDLVWLLVECKVAGVKNVDLALRQIALIGIRLANQE